MPNPQPIGEKPQKSNLEELEAIRKKAVDVCTHFDDDVETLSGSLSNMSGAEHLHGLAHASGGLGIASAVLATMSFFRTVNDFTKGEKVSLPRLGRMGYAGLTLGLLVAGIVAPVAAVGVGIAAAGAGLVVSGAHLVRGAFKKVMTPWRLKNDEKRKKELWDEIDNCGQEAEKLDASTVSKEEKNKSIQAIKARLETSTSKLEALKKQTAEHKADEHHLKSNPILVRAASVFGASLGLAGAIALAVNPVTGGILLAASAAVGFGFIARGVGKFIKNKFFNKKTAEKVDTEKMVVNDKINDERNALQETDTKQEPAKENNQPLVKDSVTLIEREESEMKKTLDTIRKEEALEEKRAPTIQPLPTPEVEKKPVFLMPEPASKENKLDKTKPPDLTDNESITKKNELKQEQKSDRAQEDDELQP